MTHALPFVAEICLSGAVIGCCYSVAAGIMTLAHARRTRRRTAPATEPPVTILKPLCGAEPELFERLTAFCTQDYAGPVQIVFGVQAASDPAIAVVRRLQCCFAHVPIALQIDEREHGSNRKVSNLINMLPLAHHGILVFSDSDIVVGPDYLSDVVASLEGPTVGLVTCLYHGDAAESVASRIAALAINTWLLPQTVTALGLRAAHPCFGVTIAMRREMLDRIGGLHPFASVLADDYAIGAAVRQTGLELAVSRSLVGHVCPDCGAAATLSRLLRVARTIKLIEPVGYVGTILANPLALAFLALLLQARGAGAVVVFAVASRMILAICVQYAFGLPRQTYWLLPLHDLVAFAMYVVSFGGKTVTWRGYRYRVARDGTMIAEDAATGPPPPYVPERDSPGKRASSPSASRT
jgi:ceramide glucosyltransferase